MRSAVVQAVCSPIRNPLDHNERRMLRGALSRPAQIVAQALARAAGVRAAPVRWRFPEDPTFDNQIATLTLAGRTARLRIERTDPDEWQDPQLHTSLDRIIS